MTPTMNFHEHGGTKYVSTQTLLLISSLGKTGGRSSHYRVDDQTILLSLALYNTNNISPSNDSSPNKGPPPSNHTIYDDIDCHCHTYINWKNHVFAKSNHCPDTIMEVKNIIHQLNTNYTQLHKNYTYLHTNYT